MFRYRGRLRMRLWEMHEDQEPASIEENMKLPIRVDASVSDEFVHGCPINIRDAAGDRVAVLYMLENPNALRDAHRIVRLLNPRKRKPSRTRKT